MKTKLYILFFLVLFAVIISGCDARADVVSRNISTAADQFEVYRRIVFYNSITNNVIFVTEGYCSLGNYDPQNELSVTCKTDSGYVKHFLGLSDNVTYYVIQLSPDYASSHHYRMIFNPGVAIPNIDLDIGN